MLASPANWEKHYHGDEKHLAQCRKYSYSDRARYYIGQPEVVAAMNKLFDNLRKYPIPMNMLHQYMPISYAKIREGQLKLDPRELAMDGIVQFMLDYESAVDLPFLHAKEEGNEGEPMKQFTYTIKDELGVTPAPPVCWSSWQRSMPAKSPSKKMARPVICVS